jgi:hypothetical protein
MLKAPVPLMVSVPPWPPESLTWGTLTLTVVQVPARQPMEPPAAWVAAADGEEAVDGEAAAGLVDEPPAGTLDELPAGVDDPPHAASSASMAAAPAVPQAAARSRPAVSLL